MTLLVYDALTKPLQAPLRSSCSVWSAFVFLIYYSLPFVTGKPYAYVIESICITLLRKIVQFDVFTTEQQMQIGVIKAGIASFTDNDARSATGCSSS